MTYYKIDERRLPIKCSLEEYKEWDKDDKFELLHRVAKDEMNGYEISTVFLGLDHSFDSKKQLLFETMIFGEGAGDQYQTRCSTWDEALEMHIKAIEYVKRGCVDE